MSKTIGIESGNYAVSQETPVGFLRKVVADQKKGEVINRPDCDLVVTDTIVTNGTTLIKAIKCRVSNCDSANCVFNK